MDKIETPEKYMLQLDLNKEDLINAIKFLEEWDKREDIFYSGMSKDSINFDKVEREHLRNSIEYWDKILNNVK